MSHMRTRHCGLVQCLRLNAEPHTGDQVGLYLEARAQQQ